jgi:fido (protein-threonine AMPylation protein)
VATPSEKLAEALEQLRSLQAHGVVAVRSADLTRTHRERLVNAGFLAEVMKGWYIPSRPDEQPGDTSTWYASFWAFCSGYLEHRFRTRWSLSPEQSLLLHGGNLSVPRQLLVRADRAGNKPVLLPHGTSLVEVRAALPAAGQSETRDGLRLFSLPAALVEASPKVFQQSPTDARVALSLVHDASDILAILLEGGKSKVAGRVAGAFRNIGRDRVAEQIVSTMKAAGYQVSEVDPFSAGTELSLPLREPSPYANRLRLMWYSMRPAILDVFPQAPGLPEDASDYLDRVEDIYVRDAYHSLSIENYRVSPELIHRVRSGEWNPDDSGYEKDERAALAARGYYLAFQSLKDSVRRVLEGENAGEVACEGHSAWYQQLFSPGVTAGILRPADLAGYRNDQVYIKGSRHTPPKREAVRDCMPVLFELLREEQEARARAVLGHFMFVFIHPYMDGNGRMGRFLMNLMLASGGYPWTVIPVQQRDAYMAALEDASVRHDIRPFANFLGTLVRARMEGDPGPEPK